MSIQIYNIKRLKDSSTLTWSTDLDGNVKGTVVGGGGGGGVTTLSIGNLSPLFTASVATPTTTPAISFSLTNAGGGTLLGNNTGSSASPSYTLSPVLGINGTSNGTLGLATSTGSGQTITLQNLGCLSAYNFNLPITAGTAGQVLTSQGGGSSSMSWATPGSGGAVASGTAITAFPSQQPSSLGAGWQGFSVITMIRAGALLFFPSSITITLSIGGVGTMNITGAVVFGCAKGDLTRTITVKSSAIKWATVSNPNLSPGDNQSDALSLVLDNAHDWYFVAHVNVTNTNTTLFGYNTNGYSGLSFAGLGGGDVNGDQTTLIVGNTIPAVSGTQTAITSINAA